MKNKKIRSLIIAVVLLVTLYFIAPLLVPNLPSFWTSKRLKLGLDLQGGMQVLLEVDCSKLNISEKKKEEVVKTALEIIRNRIDQFGVAEPLIQRAGKDRIIIQLPGLKNFGRAKDLIGKTALLEFKLFADKDQIKATYAKLDKYLQENFDKYPFLKKVQETDNVDNVDVLGNDEVKSDSLNKDEHANIFTSLLSANDLQGNIEYKDISIFKNLLKDDDFKKQIPAGVQLALGKEDKKDPYAARPVYFLRERAELTGKYLENASVKIGSGYDPKTAGKPYVSLKFNKAGAKRFENITAQNLKKPLAIVLDGIVHSAPVIQDRIRGGEASITGTFTLAECQDLVIILKAGKLPAPVNIIEERTVGPTLGSDSIKAGVLSAIIGLIIVALFMIIYYGFSGLFADFALLINIGFILAVMTMLDGTLTMPGIAGMILTIGMAVDANVLIFERIREELGAGKTVRSAVDAGFSRAIVTILDANITTLITALVLYQFGTGPIKGFAVTLSIGIIGSMFSAIVLVKALFDGFVTNVKRDKLSI